VKSLWLRFFLQTISIVRYKILWLEVEKHHFIFIIAPLVNKYIFKPNIHQNGPEILGVKQLGGKTFLLQGVLPIKSNAEGWCRHGMDEQHSLSSLRFYVDGEYSSSPLPMLASKAPLKMGNAPYLKSLSSHKSYFRDGELLPPKASLKKGSTSYL
jgi:hypothetical protein